MSRMWTSTPRHVDGGNETHAASLAVPGKQSLSERLPDANQVGRTATSAPAGAPAGVTQARASELAAPATLRGVEIHFAFGKARPRVAQAKLGGDPSNAVAAAPAGSGQQLPAETALQMENAFGADFSAVRIHEGPQAGALGALAYTQGNDIHFAPGAYDPSGQSGKELLGHELAHVVQQREGRVAQPQGKDAPINTDPALEAEADALGARAAQGARAAHPAGSTGNRDSAPPGARAAYPAGSTGNRDSAALQRASTSAPIQRVKAVFKSPHEIRGLTVGALDQYAHGQADWAMGIEDSVEKVELIGLLELLRGADGVYLSGCSAMKIGDLLQVDLRDPKIADALASFCGAVKQTRKTVQAAPVNTLEDALAQGTTLIKLEKHLSPAILSTIVQSLELELLSEDNGVLCEAFLRYIEGCNPLLHANNGKEIMSFFDYHDAGGKNLEQYKKTIKYIRNYHRFEQAALEKLEANEQNTSKKQPVTLVLHTALDPSGSFHRDANLTKLITGSDNLVLVIEGKTTLDEISALLPGIRSTYGEVDQVLLAGHGGPRSLDLAGDVVDSNGALQECHPGGALDLDKNPAETEKFLASIVDVMSTTTANRRVVFDACLSNASDASVETPGPDARQAIQSRLKARPNLVATFDRLVEDKRRDVLTLGANGSFGKAAFLDKEGDSRLGLHSENDPKLTAPDKLDYVREGKNPEGALCAVLECWANEGKRAPCLDAMQTRASDSANDWNEVLIRFFYGLLGKAAVNDQTFVQLHRLIMRVVSPLTSIKHEASCSVVSLLDIQQTLGGSAPTLYEALEQTAEWAWHWNALVFNQCWSKLVPSRSLSLLTALGDPKRTCSNVSQFIDLEMIDVAALDPADPTQVRGKILLALVAMTTQKAAAHRAYKELVGDVITQARSQDAVRKLVEALLGGRGSLSEIESFLGDQRLEQDDNIALFGAQDNNLHVRSLTRHGRVLRNVSVLDLPDGDSIGSLSADAEVYIFGQTDDQEEPDKAEAKQPLYSIEFRHVEETAMNDEQKHEAAEVTDRGFIPTNAVTLL